MLKQIKMPSLDATMEKGTIIAWKVKEGDKVKTGDVLLELESDKTTFDFESPYDGIICRIVAADGETVQVQQTIAIIGDVNEHIPSEWLNENKSEETRACTQQEQTSAEQEFSLVQDKSRGVKISPRARKLAEKLGVDITKVTGSGPNGRIESSDIEKLR
ncbi:MAG: biotin/lipoyl-containing protein [Planctomycetota bacterium]